MSTWVVQVIVVGLFALTCGALALAWMRGRLALAAIVLFVFAACAWALVFAALATGTQDADGFATCDTNCTSVHYASAVAFLAPPLLIALAAFAMLVDRGRRWRERRRPVQEKHT